MTLYNNDVPLYETLGDLPMHDAMWSHMAPKLSQVGSVLLSEWK